MPDEPRVVSFSDFSTTDLEVGTIYEGGSENATSRDPIANLLRLGIQGGIRTGRSPDQRTITRAALLSSGHNPEWEDAHDRVTGTVTYFGDNTTPSTGEDYTPVRGNQFLRSAFDNAYAGPDGRRKVAPIFYFENVPEPGRGRRVQFVGLLVPGAPGMSLNEALDTRQFPREDGVVDNYVATLKVLDIQVVPRAWIDGLINGTAVLNDAPPQWRHWVEMGFSTPTGPTLASPHDDAPSLIDALGVEEDVEVLAGLLAARESKLPLAIALLGPWGSGKSTIMAQVGRRVDTLCHESADPQLLRRVCQITFNAWHYSDEEVWIGLLDGLVAGLTAYASAQTPNDASSRLAELQTKQIANELAAAEVDASLAELNRWKGIARLSWRLVVTDGGHRVQQVRRNWPWIIASGAAIGALVSSALVLWDNVTAFSATLTAGFAVVAGLGAKGLKAFQRFKDGASQVGAKVTATTREELVAKQDELKTEAAELQQEQLQIEARLIPLSGIADLSACLDMINGDARYSSYRGLVSHVRTDLERIGHSLTRTGDQTADTVERIILYVDDLDRCSPTRVVKVLEALHLALTTPLFAIVVAVDPRWLRNALERHHEHMISSDGSTSDPGTGTAADYLDKIFQIPYALRAPDENAMSSYLQSLIAADIEQDPLVDPISNAPELEAGADVNDAGPLNDDTPVAPSTDPQQPTPESLLTRLKVTAEEAKFFEQVAVFLQTPRAAKKFVNLYRLIRLGMSTDSFVRTRDYVIAQTLLALMVGHPQGTVRAFTEHSHGDSTGSEALTLAALVSRLPVEFQERLNELIAAGTLPSNVAPYQLWYARIARYSFHPAFADLLPSTAASTSR